MPRESDVSPEVALLIATMDEAADAYISGNVRRYFTLIRHGEDYTLMPPYGGPTSRDIAITEERIETTSQFFVSGEATLEVEETYASGDLVVIAAIERQHGVIDTRPDQDLSLRVTLVFRRDGEGWELVHRHADPLVHQIPIDHLAELARGLDA